MFKPARMFQITRSFPIDYRLELTRVLALPRYQMVGRESYVVHPMVDYETIF